MKYVYHRAEGDAQSIRDFKASLCKLSLEELIDRYNQEARLGITGVRAQALFHIALRKEFLERLEQSPVILTEGTVIDLSGEVRMEGYEIVPK